MLLPLCENKILKVITVGVGFVSLLLVSVSLSIGIATAVEFFEVADSTKERGVKTATAVAVALTTTGIMSYMSPNGIFGAAKKKKNNNDDDENDGAANETETETATNDDKNEK